MPMQFWTDSTLHAYGQIFFTRHRLASLLVLATTFVYWPAGLAGLAAVLATHGLAWLAGFDRSHIEEGLWGMNGLLVALALASTYRLEPALVLVLAIGVLFTLVLSVTLTHLLARLGLPALSAPFLLGIWAIFLAARQYAALVHSDTGIFTLNELYRYGGTTLVHWYELLESWPLPRWLDLWLRSLAAIIFQENLLAGLLLSLVLLLSSRIALLMALAGFLSGYGFYLVVGADLGQLAYSYIGFNFILSAIALGAFFYVPSWRTFLLVVLMAPVIGIALGASASLLAVLYLPTYSLPFVVLVLATLYATSFIARPDLLPRPAVQTYSPEHNLYAWANYMARFGKAVWTHLYLPFMGEWKVSQGHDGQWTHRGHWRHAWDFVVTDEQGRTFRNDGRRLEDYFCYNLPVTAPADGYVVEVVDHVPDNEPGHANLHQNWGNAVVIRHVEGLYSNLAHLREGTISVKKGDFVRRGQPIARLGNSGRSPEPHLHFQVQATPWVGSRTIAFPLAAWIRLSANGTRHFHMYDYPQEGQVVGNVEPHRLLSAAFRFEPGQILRFEQQGAGGASRTVEWEIRTDTYGKPYIECLDSGSRVWYYRDEFLFYCTAFEGDRCSLLYGFYLSAFKVVLGLYPGMTLDDTIALHHLLPDHQRWPLDFIAPFAQPLRSRYRMQVPAPEGQGTAELHSHVCVELLGRCLLQAEGRIRIGAVGIEHLAFAMGRRHLRARRLPHQTATQLPVT